MILVDTSAWIDFDRDRRNSMGKRVAALVGEGAPLASTEPVLAEMLAGARDDAAADRLRRLLTSLRWIPVEPTSDFEAAADIYRACRTHGVTPGSLLDCMIAAIAMRSGAQVLSSDRDFARIADVLPLRLA